MHVILILQLRVHLYIKKGLHVMLYIFVYFGLFSLSLCGQYWIICNFTC